MWNGTAEILNAKPTSSRPVAASIIGETFMPDAAIHDAMRSSLVDPVSV